jgi:uncharacterized membrane protein YdjX (TVP38/TMEM64 family)
VLGGGLREPERLRDWLEATGVLAPALYVAVFACLTPFGLPAVLMVMAAVGAWPLGWAFALTWAGAVGAGVVGFAFARWLARDWVMAHLPERFRHLDERAGERPLATVLLLRLFFFLAPPAHWALGVSRVGFGTHLFGTALGYVPWVLAYTLGGRGALELVRTQPPWVWIPVGALVAAVWLAVGWKLRGRRSDRVAAAASSDPRG